MLCLSKKSQKALINAAKVRSLLVRIWQRRRNMTKCGGGHI